MSNNFPADIFGICPIGHNPRPSGTVGSDSSSTQIDENEGRQLHWSDYYQKYVCSMCIEDAKDLVHDDKAHQQNIDMERKLAGMGFIQS